MNNPDPFHEDDELEKLKKWWAQNGTGLMLGVGLGLAIVAGYQYWERTTLAAAEKASAYFEVMQASLRDDNKAPAEEQANRLIGESSDSVYAVFAAMQAAKVQYQAGEKEAAIAQLRWVLGQQTDPALQHLARLRLARLLFEQDAQAADLPSIIETGLKDAVFAGEYQVLKGDLAIANGDLETAKQAYQAALEYDVNDEIGLRMKLADLGVSS